jgi:2-oxoglutarate ferredoxin oxidoreductase subunit gamma
MKTQTLYEQIIIAGFGGQGIILAGKLLAQAAMHSGKEVTYMPSYGAEMRGGTANCMVIIADEPIASPLVENPDSAIVMNQASLDKFAEKLTPGGLLIYNSSLANQPSGACGALKTVAIPADDIALELGDKRCANMVALGAYLESRNCLRPDAAAEALPDVLAKRYHNTIKINTDALHRGADFVKNVNKND